VDATRGQRLLTIVVVALMALTAIGLLALHPYGGPPAADQAGFAQVEEERVAARIVAVRDDPDGAGAEFLLPGAREVVVEVELEDGRRLVIPAVDETGGFEVGRAVEVARVSAPGTPETYAIVDFQRGAPLAVLVVLFALAVVALGRWQGVRALVGLGVCAVIVVGFLVPALLAGRDPTLVALVAAMAVMCTTLPLSHGWSATTRAAAAGTAVALLATIGLAHLAVDLTALTGLSSEDVQLVRFATGRPIDVRGLLLAGIIVGTLGVLDDVTVSQASTVAALRRLDPTAPARRVAAEALRVGRDHIAATVNTLFLAYAGAALPLLILFSVGGAPVGETLTSELVAQEVVRTLVGSIGLVLAVPLTTAIAALAVPPGSGGHVHGHVPGPVKVTDAPAPDAPPRQIPAPAGEDVAPAPWEEALRTRYGLDDR
jgi:uncharacterized membrane protein